MIKGSLRWSTLLSDQALSKGRRVWNNGPMNKQHVPIYIALGFVIIVGLLITYELFEFSVVPRTETGVNDTPRVTIPSVPQISNVSDHRIGQFTRIDADYPRFTGELAVMNKPIEDLIKGGIEEHEKIAAENWKARVDTAEPRGSVAEFPSANEKFPYYASWSLLRYDESNVSILVNYGSFSGGAHGQEAVATYNYDLVAHKLVTLGDLLAGDLGRLEKLSKNVIAALAEERKSATGEKVLSEDELRWISEGAGPKIENFKDFTIEGNKITFYFADYQVGPHAVGRPKIAVPFPLE